jgi:hypothetical protein
MACKLQAIGNTPNFQAPENVNVTLGMNDHIGVVLISKAEYAGKQLVPDNQAVASITFDVAAGSNRLAIVFVFSAGTSGVSELREGCDGGSFQHLRDIVGDEPFQSITIVGV